MRTPAERERLVALFLEGELPAADRPALREELRADPAFADEVAGLLLTDRLLALDRGGPAGETFAREVVEFLRTRPAGAEFSGKVLDRVRRRARLRPHRTTPFLFPALAAAALLAVALVAVVASRGTPPPPSAPEARVEMEPPPPVAPPPTPKPETLREMARPAGPPPPSPALPQPRAEEKRPAERPAPPAPAPPPPAPLREERTTPDVPRFKAVAIANIKGALYLEGGANPVATEARLNRTDRVLTRHRRGARFDGPGYRASLETNSSLQLQEEEGGPTLLSLHSGAVYLEVGKRSAPFRVRTPHGEVGVVGTAFQVELDERRTHVAVVEGTVRLKNEKGEVVLQARQRSSVRAGERPAAASRLEGDLAARWRMPESLPYSEHEAGASRKFAGLVLAAPFYDGEAESGRLARATAERMDVGLVLGYGYRDPARKVCINVDRGMEAEVRDDGTAGNTLFTDRARKATADYLDHARQAAGVRPREAMPLVVQFRNHYLADADVCEVAASGFPRKTAADAKAYYAQLLDKHKPAYRLEMRFQGVDDAYELEGRKRRFFFTEEDARVEGYMAPAHSRNAVAFFLNPGFGKREADYEAYSRILSELVEFLWVRRR